MHEIVEIVQPGIIIWTKLWLSLFIWFQNNHVNFDEDLSSHRSWNM
jgi:hypothetical protein